MKDKKISYNEILQSKMYRSVHKCRLKHVTKYFLLQFQEMRVTREKERRGDENERQFSASRDPEAIFIMNCALRKMGGVLLEMKYHLSNVDRK